MRRRLVLFALSLVIISSVIVVLAQQRRTSSPPARSSAGDYTLSGPYSHDNLTVFLLHGPDRMTGKAPLTLQEGLAKKKVVVHETKDVNQLSIENLSDEEVYVQSGDIVKGGQQDRTLAHDLIVPPRSGKMALEAFCVEQGRWSGRGGESTLDFSVSVAQLNSKDLKLAAKRSRSQQEVWSKVSESQEKLARNLIPADPFPADPRTTPRPAGGLAPASPTSLQLTLENSDVKASSQEYTRLLASIVNDKADAIGYVFAINGRVNSADVYGSNALFRKLWPKLLEASAIEAFSERDQKQASRAVTVADVRAALQETGSGKEEMKDVTERVRLVTRENEKGVFYETRDRARKDAWVHRNYLTK